MADHVHSLVDRVRTVETSRDLVRSVVDILRRVEFEDVVRQWREASAVRVRRHQARCNVGQVRAVLGVGCSLEDAVGGEAIEGERGNA